MNYLDYLLPKPRRMVIGKGIFPVPQGFLEQLETYRLGDRLPESIGEGTGEPTDDEGYRLEIEPESITIHSREDAGKLYALQTLRQMLYLGELPSLPCVFIEDSPSFSTRGLLIDISRNRVPTRETLTLYLDLLLLLKYNQFHLYTEHTFAYSAHKRVWEGWSPLTAEDIRWLDREAQTRNIELVPNQNSFGHLTRFLEHTEYRHLAEAPDGFVTPWGRKRPYPFSLSPAVPETRDFLAGLYDELLPNFSSNLFNVGCDETFDLGQGRSRDICESRGTGEVYLSFLQDVHRMVTERGKRMVFYGDILNNHPEVIDRVPRDAIAVEWWYEAENEFQDHCRRFAESGLEFLVAPGTSSWNSITGRYTNAAANVRAAVDAAERFGALGILMTDWGDNGHLQAFPVAPAPLVLAGALAWNTSDLDANVPYELLQRIPVRWGGLGAPDAPGKLGSDGESDASGVASTSGILASALRRLGEISDRVGPGALNSSIFGLSLVNYEVEEYFKLLITHQFDEAALRSELAEIRRTLSFPDPVDEAIGRLRDEVVTTIDLAGLALDLIPYHRMAGGVSIPTPPRPVSDISVCIEKIEDDFRSQWLSRFRPGGLERSVIFLRKAFYSIVASL